MMPMSVEFPTVREHIACGARVTLRTAAGARGQVRVTVPGEG